MELYQTTFDPDWYVAANELARTMVEHFEGPNGGFFDTSDDHEALIVRPRDLQDNAMPSGNAMAAWVLAHLSGLAVDPSYLEQARAVLGPMQQLLVRYPLGFAQWLIAQDYVLSHPREVAYNGDLNKPDTHSTIHVFIRHGLSCVGCAIAQFENVGQGAQAHRIDVDELVKDLNDTVLVAQTN